MQKNKIIDAKIAEYIGKETFAFLNENFLEDLDNWTKWFKMLGGENEEYASGSLGALCSWIVETPEGKQFLNKMFRKVSLGRE